MNRYTATGLLLDAIAGKRVLVLAATSSEETAAFSVLQAEVSKALCVGDVTIVRTNGRRSISIDDAGKLSFLVASDGVMIEPLQHDVVFLDHGARRLLMTDARLHHEVHHFGASGGEVIHP